jgi:hypothetical protein
LLNITLITFLKKRTIGNTQNILIVGRNLQSELIHISINY